MQIQSFGVGKISVSQVSYTMLSIKNFTHVSTNFMPIWIEIQTWSKHKKGTLTCLFLAEKEINFLSQTPVSKNQFSSFAIFFHSAACRESPNDFGNLSNLAAESSKTS